MKKIISLIILCFCLQVQAQERKEVPFNGMITDLLGAPVKRAKIILHSSGLYTYSDKKGRFGLTNVKENDTLTITYKKVSYDIAVGNKKSAKIRLGDVLEINEDDQLISYGYGYVKKREYTNSGNLLTGNQLMKEGYTSVMEAIRGRIPGLNISGGTGFGETSNVTIRGVNSIYGSSTPLFLLDEVEVTSFDGVNLSDVERIEVIKDANIYGVKGANGVIKVTTRKGLSK